MQSGMFSPNLAAFSTSSLLILCSILCRYAGSVILSLTYGKPSPSNKSDPNVAIINEGLVRVGEASRPGAYLVEQLPWLKYIPFYGMKLKRWHREELTMFKEQLDGVRDDMVRLASYCLQCLTSSAN